ncbi:GHMP kinase [Adhaeribacter arboris]|uniref:GHMP kinase n=1 Tax=Adhaeribacter arboris TaxID=2072846 RepID=A0A2T2YIT4_9BACT|nr:GHMP kinase [Adhaeribacter arboris]PSR55423.1 GHMP kinase [Adhaeribacter arboris]
MIIEARAYARAAILGNPSDGYFGKTISLIVKNFGAHILLYQTPELVIEPQPQDINQFKNIFQLQDQVNLTGYHGGAPLLKAAIKKFVEYCQQQQIKLDNKNFTIRYNSSIPRQIGLAGSSAIIIATLRGLMQFYNVQIPQEILPNLALAVETEELGINAGLQDRVIQTYEGCVYMNFDKQLLAEKKHGLYEPLDPDLLPNLYIAYKTELGKVSGKVLNDIKTRYDKGDPHVINTLNRIASLADAGKTALLQRDYTTLHQLMNENFDQRCQIMKISESNMELINTARQCGASATFTGSGGSVIGIYENDEMLNKLVAEMRKVNARVIKPTIV